MEVNISKHLMGKILHVLHYGRKIPEHHVCIIVTKDTNFDSTYKKGEIKVFGCKENAISIKNYTMPCLNFRQRYLIINHDLL